MERRIYHVERTYRKQPESDVVKAHMSDKVAMIVLASNLNELWLFTRRYRRAFIPEMIHLQESVLSLSNRSIDQRDTIYFAVHRSKLALHRREYIKSTGESRRKTPGFNE